MYTVGVMPSLYLPWCILMCSNQFVVLKYIVVKISKILQSVGCSFYLSNAVHSLNFGFCIFVPDAASEDVNQVSPAFSVH